MNCRLIENFLLINYLLVYLVDIELVVSRRTNYIDTEVEASGFTKIELLQLQEVR